MNIKKQTVGLLGLAFASTIASAFAMDATVNAAGMMKAETTMHTDSMMKKDSMMKTDSSMSMNLMMGSRGIDVTSLQTFLEEKGFLNIPNGVAKGYFGKATKMALMKYQASEGVSSTGYFGPMTRAKMHMGMMAKEGMMKKDSMMNTDTMMKKDESKMMEKKADGAMMKTGSYEVYSPSKIITASADHKVVLFFRASWCPTCIAVDADIKAQLKNIPENLTVLDVNYDDSTELKKKYGVTYQHTFVQVDAQGNLIKKWSGSPTLSSLVSEVK